MKGEIKYRAWDGEKMRVVDLLNTNSYCKTVYTVDDLEPGHFEAYDRMLSTDLYDKNGKEIYEGDILMLSNGTKVPVEFKLGSFYIFDEPLAWDFDDIDAETREISRFDTTRYTEVVGNIHENPELLK